MNSPIAERPARQGAVADPTSIECAENAEEAEAAAVYQVEAAVREALAGDSAHAARLADDLGRLP